MRTLFIFALTINFVFGQTIDKLGRTIEQNALDYLVCNLPNIELKYENGCYNFNPDSNKIWYQPKVQFRRDTRVRIPKSFQATDTEFYYAICDKKDIYIMTNAHKELSGCYTVEFYIVTQVNHYTSYTVLIDMELIPYKIQDDEFNSGHAGETYQCSRYSS